ncbi:MAG: ABC transporter permease, partial [Rhodospirillaceae bacterium]|nr:ABC transporter permease [Rhodospirillaceae bacterium]
PAGTASIEASAPWLRNRADFVYAGKRIVGDRGEVMGVTAAFADLNKLRLSDGRFISDLDVRRYYCVIGADVAAAMRRAGAGQIVGASLKVADRLYTVVGVLRDSPRGRRPFRANVAALVPITTAQRTFERAEITRVIARMKPDVHHAVAAKEVQDYFRRQSSGLRVAVESAKQLIEHMQKQMQLFTLLLGAVGSISLIVGGVGVMNVMLVSVSERRKEIGIRRALGAQRRTIQSQFLIESVILSLLGGVFGVGLGVGASYAICRFTGWTFLVSPAAMVLGVGVASGVGIFFGLYPAYQAARLDPIAALRSE